MDFNEIKNSPQYCFFIDEPIPDGDLFDVVDEIRDVCFDGKKSAIQKFKKYTMKF